MNKTTALLFLALLFGARLAMAQDVKNSNYPFFAQGEIPLYPTVAKTARLSGNVKVQVTVRDGSIVTTDTISGDPLLASATLANIKTWQFFKGTNTIFTTTFMYQLEKEETPEPSNPRIELDLPVLVKITAKPTKRPCQDCRADDAHKSIE